MRLGLPGRVRPSIRLRLALWCAGLVTGSGAIVVLVVLALTGQVLHDRAQPPPAPAAPSAPGGPPAGAPPTAQRQIDSRRGAVVDETLQEAREIGLAAVAGLALVSIGIGWIVAGRMLAPVATLARAAREVSETSLHRRLSLTGPRDELRSLAEAFDAMLDRLERAFNAQRRFVADASHELRTPLATIRAEVESVLEDPAAGQEEIQAAAARIITVLNRSDRLVTALLTLSRSDVVEQRPELDLADIAEEAVTACPGIGGFSTELGLAPAPVRGDRALLERLAGNLIENACRYNRPGGTVAVTTGSAGDRSVLTVINDGPQVPAEDVPELTARFRRRTRTPGGFGLGLAIAEAVARGHGGELQLRARLEGGLEVRAELPRTTVALTAAPAHPEAQDGTARRQGTPPGP